jgi:hypothetical protein
MAFYCVTNSNKDKITGWINDTGAEYEFLEADEVTLKTIIRSNPGLVFIKDGTVMMKWHYNDFPTEETLQNEMQGILTAKEIKNNKENKAWIVVIFCFTLPLFLVWVYDFFRNRKRGIVYGST